MKVITVFSLQPVLLLIKQLVNSCSERNRTRVDGMQVICCIHCTTDIELRVELKLFLYGVSIYGVGVNKTLVYVFKVSQN